MEPRFSQNWRHMRRRVNIVSCGEIAARAECCKFFRIPLVHPTKSAEFSLDAVVVSVMIGITSNKAVPADAVASLHPLDYMDRKRETRNPGLPRRFIGEVKLGGRGIAHLCFRTEVVLDRHEEMRLP